ncbi:hypothetical protein LMG667_19740 [Xanthomonas euvesicatoria]|uniref:hypothetical protein n=1 Tax=Xanthomonas euvesicatoria TaxID=456327 RepID=UPI00080EA67C|nr:hypothetical protein [Xanthomonas euvesicatoria]OCG82129.1 hypothetical protein LMG667_19740 [Xanthomonas euvesicatoria]
MHQALPEKIFQALQTERVPHASIGQLDWHPKKQDDGPTWYVTAFSTPDFAMALMRNPVDPGLLPAGEDLYFETDNYTSDARKARRIAGNAASQHLIVF